MEFPIRCFTCGNVIGHLYNDYKEMVNSGMSPKEALDKLGVKRYCCRRMFISHVEVIKEVINYKRP